MYCYVLLRSLRYDWDIVVAQCTISAKPQTYTSEFISPHTDRFKPCMMLVVRRSERSLEALKMPARRSVGRSNGRAAHCVIIIARYSQSPCYRYVDALDAKPLRPLRLMRLALELDNIHARFKHQSSGLLDVVASIDE